MNDHRGEEGGVTVATLRPATIEPRQVVVAALEEALALARAGELRSVVISGSLIGNQFWTKAEFEDGTKLLGHMRIHEDVVIRGMMGGHE